ncbi:MAG: hypothetical protein Q9224_007607, partial [Gallowayella concinna]
YIFYVFALLLSITSLAVSTTARAPLGTRSGVKSAGINCRGSSQCSFTTNTSPTILAEFNSTLYSNTGASPPGKPFLPGGPIQDLELYYKGEHIICARNLRWLVGSICIFLQGEYVPKSGVPGFVIKRLVSQMSRHGCKFCGSVPVSEDNDPFRLGVLTSNFVVGESRDREEDGVGDEDGDGVRDEEENMRKKRA